MLTPAYIECILTAATRQQSRLVTAYKMLHILFLWNRSRVAEAPSHLPRTPLWQRSSKCQVRHREAWRFKKTDFTPKAKQMLATLKKAEDAISQTILGTKNDVTPTALSMSTMLECGRRDSFLDHLKICVQDDTAMN